jgi:hypothetical protein
MQGIGKIKYNIGDKVVWHDIPVTITDLWVVDDALYSSDNGIYYFVKSEWFCGSVKQYELGKA